MTVGELMKNLGVFPEGMTVNVELYQPALNKDHLDYDLAEIDGIQIRFEGQNVLMWIKIKDTGK